jgi:hypothetical protein
MHNITPDCMSTNKHKHNSAQPLHMHTQEQRHQHPQGMHIRRTQSTTPSPMPSCLMTHPQLLVHISVPHIRQLLSLQQQQQQTGADRGKPTKMRQDTASKAGGPSHIYQSQYTSKA